MVTSFVGIAYFSQELGAGGVGTFFLFQALTQVLVFGTDLGLNGAITKRISEGYDPGQILAAGLLGKAGLMTIASIGILLLRGQVNNYVGLETAVLLCTAVVFAGYANTALQLLKSEMQMKWFAALQFTDTLLFTSLGAGFVVAGHGPIGLVYSLLLSKVLVTGVALLRSKTRPRLPTLTHAYSLYEFSKYNIIGKLIGRANSWVDVLVVGALLTQSHVGAYEVAWRVSKLSVLLASAASNVIFPTVSQLNAEAAVERIRETIADGLVLALVLPVPALVGVVLLSDNILSLAFGPDFTLAVAAVIVLSVGRNFNAINKIAITALRGLDRPDEVARAGIIAVTVNAIGNVVLVWAFGLVGAAAATTLSYVATTFIVYYYLSNQVPITVEYRVLVWILLASLLMGGVVLKITNIVSISSLPVLVLVIAFAAALYGLTLCSSGDIRRRVTVLVGR